jgi:hypothetical protein
MLDGQSRGRNYEIRDSLDVSSFAVAAKTQYPGIQGGERQAGGRFFLQCSNSADRR